jgi:hypothetical protein
LFGALDAAPERIEIERIVKQAVTPQLTTMGLLESVADSNYSLGT